MAIDEALLEGASRMGQPLLRFYEWTEPAATFGYFQRYPEVERMTPLRPLIRRPTGGGLVPHDADWTYSLIFPPTDPWYTLRAVESYERVHRWIQAAFARAGVAADLAPSSRPEGPGQCFIGAERFDLLWQDRKMAGAAQRRTRDGQLIQGSIQPPPGVSLAGWRKALCDVAREEWGVTWLQLGSESFLELRAQELVREKYSTPEYNRREGKARHRD